jgi:ABC-type transport system substrate-binding protein
LDTESYVAKDDYFLGTPYVRRIEMIPADDPLTSLRVGQLDGAATAAAGARSEVLAPFRDDPEYGIAEREIGFCFPLFFNLSRGGALADLRFRRACLHAIDRQDMVGRLLTGNGEVGSQGFLPPSHDFYNPEVVNRPGLVGGSRPWKRGWSHAEGDQAGEADDASVLRGGEGPGGAAGSPASPGAGDRARDDPAGR